MIHRNTAFKLKMLKHSFAGQMQSLTTIRSSDLSSLSGAAFSLPRTQLSFPKKVFLCRAKFAESVNEGSFCLRVVPPSLLAAEREEAKAVLTLFLKKQGLSNAVAARTINKSEPFIDHLVSRLHSVHKSRYLVGRELTTLEIRDALIPYLETLLEEFGDILVDLVENFPNPPIKERSIEKLSSPPEEGRPVVPVSTPNTAVNSKRIKAVDRVTKVGPAGKLPPHVVYLTELGMELELIKELTRKFPSFAYYSLEGKIKPVVEFLLDLGVPKSDIPTILSKRPQLCGISLSDNLIPTMTFLENLGVDKKQWAKVIHRFPALLTYSWQKLKGTADFLYEMGLSAESVGKILTRWPTIISYSVEDNLRPTAEYFRSLGVDVALLLHRSPQTFGLSIEGNLKPVTEFFFERGYSMGDVATMISRYGALYTFSLSDNLIPKWEFFLTMGYPKSELIKFPQYFGYSLEERIKPRYAIVEESGVRLLLNQVLSLSDSEFDKALKRKIKKNQGSRR
ncbi:transcription termination factor MTERF5, chloroplastic-like isoform X2 [Actinidia eriantha]|uniref:transcription termination factor MTERF5, chloroplastic-like isoform X2 n=1 Tax=Actinidia eriantha TaxID=165200 RepID=UPI0025899B6C|nr:transcription termination factor MTERF5, chloroplastic-like isoform X2 [Actinidia eriantha]